MSGYSDAVSTGCLGLRLGCAGLIAIIGLAAVLTIFGIPLLILVLLPLLFILALF